MLNPGTSIVSRDMMESVLEALIGAVNQDSGLDTAQEVMEHLGFLEDPLLKP